MNGVIYLAKGVKGFQKGHKHSEEVKKKIGDANRNQVYFNCDYCGQISSDACSWAAGVHKNGILSKKPYGE